jgi:GntR family histidine utilization transcriptional repressor
MTSYQKIQADVLHRIRERVWPPGELIPGEVELAEEFKCARATVNRALRELADTGILDRRRKAGTRVALNPARRATMKIPVIRCEVEQHGSIYTHILRSQKMAIPTASIAAKLKLVTADKMLHMRTLHQADNKPFMYEDRWVNPRIVPEILKADLSKISTNEWLVQNAPFTSGTITLAAITATREIAKALEIDRATAILLLERITWHEATPITTARLAYAPGYQMMTRL